MVHNLTTHEKRGQFRRLACRQRLNRMLGPAIEPILEHALVERRQNAGNANWMGGSV